MKSLHEILQDEAKRRQMTDGIAATMCRIFGDTHFNLEGWSGRQGIFRIRDFRTREEESRPKTPGPDRPYISHIIITAPGEETGTRYTRESLLKELLAADGNLYKVIPFGSRGVRMSPDEKPQGQFDFGYRFASAPAPPHNPSHLQATDAAKP